MRAFAVATLGVALLAMSGCNFNVFAPIDHATNNDQLLSAARACLDQGNFQCALDDYQKLPASDADIANSEEAFALYDQSGLSIGNFVGAVGTGGNALGTSISDLAAELSNNAGQSTRLAIFHGYQKILNISDPTLRGMVRFVGAIGLMSEVLAEAAQTKGKFLATDLAVTPTACEGVGFPACGNNTGTANPCYQPNNIISADQPTLIPFDVNAFTATTDPLAQATDADVDASFNTVYISLLATEQAISNLALGINSGPLGFVTSLTGSQVEGYVVASPGGAIAPCFRELLLNQGIGSSN